MGRIAPRREKATRNRHISWQSRLCFFRQRRIQTGRTGEHKETDTASAAPLIIRQIKMSLNHIWHLSDGYHWMDPLPHFHRRWILIATGFLLLVLLWPYSSPQSPLQSHQESGSIPLTMGNIPMQAKLVDNMPAPEASTTNNQWKNYQIVAGQTLAQLFRDNNLPVNDVFAMAQVEGRNKPLNNLHAGQKIKLQLNAQGMVSELEIETPENQVIQFVRQQDGSFIRTR